MLFLVIVCSPFIFIDSMCSRIHHLIIHGPSVLSSISLSSFLYCLVCGIVTFASWNPPARSLLPSCPPGNCDVNHRRQEAVRARPSLESLYSCCLCILVISVVPQLQTRWGNNRVWKLEVWPNIYVLQIWFHWTCTLRTFPWLRRQNSGPTMSVLSKVVVK